MGRELRANLMLHCGAQEVGYDAIKAVPVPAPTETHHPIPHNQVVDLMLDTLHDSGYQVLETVHALTRDGGNYFGLAQVTADFLETDEYGLVVGFRNSHIKAYQAGAVAGAQIFVCDNLSFTGEIKFGHKHTVNIEKHLPEVFLEGVSRLKNRFLSQEIRFEAYKEGEIKDPNEFIINLYRQNIIVTTEIGKIIDIWDNPTHEEYGEQSAWTMFNAVTEALKGKLARLPSSTIKLQNCLDQEVELVLPEAA
jgi:hypothetical protein